MTPPLLDFKVRGAFTLVELLVAMTVGVLLLVLTVSIIGQSSEVTRQTTAGLLATAAASSAVDLIATDLESMAGTAPGTILEMIPSTSVTSFGSYGELFFLAIPGGENESEADRGQVRAIAYRIVDRDPIRGDGGPNPTPGLYRTVISASSTFSNFIGQENLAQAFASTPPSLDDFLVGDVAALEIRFFNTTDRNPANVTNGAFRSVRLTGNSTMLGGSPLTGASLAWLEVSISVLENRDDILTRLRSSTTQSADTLQLIESHSQRLSRRIPLRRAL